jgi:hypothetical protein
MTVHEVFQTVERLKQRNAALVAMLRRLEWEGVVYDFGDEISGCLVCKSRYYNGHRDDCELAKLIEEAT